MVEALSLKIQGTNQTYTVNCEHRGYASAVLGRLINGEVTQAEVEKLKQAAASSKGKNANLIEACEIENDLCRTAAERGYYEYYDIAQEDGLLKVRVRETDTLYPDPQGYDIRKDFGLREGQLYDENKALFNSKRPFFNGTGWANKVEFGANEVVEMPASDVRLQESPRGFWRRGWF